MMTIITSGEPYPTIRDLVMVLLGLPNLFARKTFSFGSFFTCYLIEPLLDLSEDVEAHDGHPDEGGEEAVVADPTWRDLVR